MPAAAKDSAPDITVMSLMLARVEEIAANTSVMAKEMTNAITDIRKEVHEVEVQVTAVATKMDSVIRTLGSGDDSIPSNIVNLQTRVKTLEEELRVSRDQGSRVKMAWMNSFLFPIFLSVLQFVVGYVLLHK